MNPRLILAVIAGGATGVFTLVLFNAGLQAPASPGSIIAVLAMTPKASYLGVIASVIASCAVSFLISSFFVKLQKEDSADKLEEAQAASKAMKGGASQQQVTDYNGLKKIFVSCDAGMGSSAMGASMLRKKVNDAGLSIEVANCAINDLPEDARLVITHQDLTLRAKKQTPNAMHLSLTNFLDNKFYDSLVNDLKVNFDEKAPITELKDNEISVNGTTFSLKPEQIFLGLEASDKFEAIRFAGEQLVKAGFVQPSYVDAMFEREKLVSTYLGEGVAVPHGTIEAKDAVLKTGVVVCQYPAGVRFTDDEDGVAKLVIGIAARNNEHIQVVSAITNALDSEEAIALLTSTNDVNKVLELLKA